ncbi:unnamed protein product [Cuscuta epithymum]|uniref:Late embryogenesis abundant protein LEA-2 subgroup domain-containing protein n=1 Tax=Cuscuta epithymum TaxID=186058 RepID=A0AAV0F7H5_9ASTE|nr:unnamed protein product [Cuscuta epithymum]
MEERVPPAGEDGREVGPASPAIPPAETYVVQIPRDQVYRVPPPENSKIVESYRGRSQNKDTGHLRRCFSGFVAPLLLLVISVAAFVATVDFLYAVKSPKFSVARVDYQPKNSTLAITLRVENGNERSTASLGSGGKWSLLFKTHTVATGRFPIPAPSVSLEPGGRKDVDLNAPVGGKLSGGLQRELVDGKAPKSMTLKVSGVAVEVWSWAKGTKKKEGTIITCDFKVDSLTKKTKLLLSQQCRTTF